MSKLNAWITIAVIVAFICDYQLYKPGASWLGTAGREAIAVGIGAGVAMGVVFLIGWGMKKVLNIRWE